VNGRITVLGGLAAALALGGCVSSPTYGTDKTAGTQLLDDVSNMAALGPKKREQIAYNPRPELVRPAPGKAQQLPAPQNAIETAGNPSWPESPEARRKRIRDTATANQNNPNFVPEVAADPVAAGSGGTDPQYGFFNDKVAANTGKSSSAGADYRARKVASTAGSSTTRRYLSEPPLEYRQPAASAASNELGEDESVKERERKAAARKDKGFSWRNLIPWQ